MTKSKNVVAAAKDSFAAATTFLDFVIDSLFVIRHSSLQTDLMELNP